MATIEVRRAKLGAGILTDLVITCDDREVAKLRADQSVTVDVIAGRHVVAASMHQATSPSVEVDLETGDHVILVGRLPMKAVGRLLRQVRPWSLGSRKNVDLTGAVDLHVIT
jgi:hypothetical protein